MFEEKSLFEIEPEEAKLECQGILIDQSKKFIKN